MKANERMHVLANNGIDTSKFFQITLDKDAVRKGIVLKLDGDTLTASLADEADELRKAIRSGGTVACTKLYRRWICAQMLRIQSEIGRGKWKTIEDYMRNFNFEYMRDVIADEVKALIRINKDRDHDTYNERNVFFSIRTIYEIYNQWESNLRYEIDNAKVHIQNRNKWGAEQKEYITIGNRHFYLDEARFDVSELSRLLSILIHDNNYVTAKEITEKMNAILEKYNNGRTEIYSVPTAFMDAYKASGAYYTLKNLVLFHNCYLTNYRTRELLLGTEAFEYLKTYLNGVCCGRGYQLYALMKQCLKDNNVQLNNLF